MTLETAVAAAMFAGVVTYAVLGGADFGSGFWDLTAGNAERGGRIRALIDHSIGPVWEANHVWLIYVLVFWWTAFPRTFAAATTTLYLPFALALLGIVLRGASFAFRKFSDSMPQARLFGAIFATSSVLTPFFLGTVAGAIASGRVPAAGHGNAWSSWLNVTSILGGVLAVGTCSFLAGVFLTADAQRALDRPLAELLRTRTLAVGVLIGVVVLAGLIPLRHDAPTLAHGLQGRAAAFVVLSAVAGGSTLWLLWRRNYPLARFTAVAAVGSVVLGWGVGQYPWLLVGQVTIAGGAGARASLAGLLIVVALAAVVVAPALGYLFWLTQQQAWSEPHGHALEE
jgi:cytochrome bd ubiquinol oxidase subunit II